MVALALIASLVSFLFAIFDANVSDAVPWGLFFLVLALLLGIVLEENPLWPVTWRRRRNPPNA